MAEERNMALVILGVVAILAIVGLVLLFTKMGKTGAIPTMAGCNNLETPVLAPPGLNPNFLEMWQQAGYTCYKSEGHDAFAAEGGFARQPDQGFETWCCAPPQGVPVEPHYQSGRAPIETLEYPGYPGYRGPW